MRRHFGIDDLLEPATAAAIWTEANRQLASGPLTASVRITLIDRDVPSYFQSLEHLLRYCARLPFALERLSVIRGRSGRS